MFSVVYLSYKNADQEALKGNEFDFEPIKEVAYLFIGIFLTMIPALQLIAYEAGVLSDKLNAGVFFWATGSLSRSEEHTSELQSRPHLVCRLLLEKKNTGTGTIAQFVSRIYKN